MGQFLFRGRYAERWECELYFRELKLDVRNAPALASQTPETALQEIAALVLASAVLARLRVEAGTQLKVAPQRMSFYKLKLATAAAVEHLRDHGHDAHRGTASAELAALHGVRAPHGRAS